MNDDLTPEQQTAHLRIHDLLGELTDLVGPSFDGRATEDLEPDEMPQGAVFINEWVVIAAWMDETGAGFTTRVTSANLPSYHRTGLLHEGLYGFGD